MRITLPIRLTFSRGQISLLMPLGNRDFDRNRAVAARPTLWRTAPAGKPWSTTLWGVTTEIVPLRLPAKMEPGAASGRFFDAVNSMVFASDMRDGRRPSTVLQRPDRRDGSIAWMIIRDLTLDGSGTARIISASVSWEDRDYPGQLLTFATREHNGEPRRSSADEPSADTVLAACFPLAAVHGEARVRIEGRPCPMLVEGLLTAHSWWTSWGGMPTPAPRIEGLSGAGPRPRPIRVAVSVFCRAASMACTC